MHIEHRIDALPELETPVGAVTLRSRSLGLRWAGGGAIWNRPLDVLVRRGDTVTHTPLTASDSQIALGIVGAGVALGLVAWARLRRTRG